MPRRRKLTINEADHGPAQSSLGMPEDQPVPFTHCARPDRASSVRLLSISNRPLRRRGLSLRRSIHRGTQQLLLQLLYAPLELLNERVSVAESGEDRGDDPHWQHGVRLVRPQNVQT